MAYRDITQSAENSTEILSTDINHIETLPTELILKIAQHLDVLSLIEFAVSSKRISLIIFDEKSLRHQLSKYLFNDLRRSGNRLNPSDFLKHWQQVLSQKYRINITRRKIYFLSLLAAKSYMLSNVLRRLETNNFSQYGFSAPRLSSIITGIFMAPSIDYPQTFFGDRQYDEREASFHFRESSSRSFGYSYGYRDEDTPWARRSSTTSLSQRGRAGLRLILKESVMYGISIEHYVPEKQDCSYFSTWYDDSRLCVYKADVECWVIALKEGLITLKAAWEAPSAEHIRVLLKPESLVALKQKLITVTQAWLMSPDYLDVLMTVQGVSALREKLITVEEASAAPSLDYLESLLRKQTYREQPSGALNAMRQRLLAPQQAWGAPTPQHLSSLSQCFDNPLTLAQQEIFQKNLLSEDQAWSAPTPEHLSALAHPNGLALLEQNVLSVKQAWQATMPENIRDLSDPRVAESLKLGTFSIEQALNAPRSQSDDSGQSHLCIISTPQAREAIAQGWITLEQAWQIPPYYLEKILSESGVDLFRAELLHKNELSSFLHRYGKREDGYFFQKSQSDVVYYKLSIIMTFECVAILQKFRCSFSDVFKKELVVLDRVFAKPHKLLQENKITLEQSFRLHEYFYRLSQDPPHRKREYDAHLGRYDDGDDSSDGYYQLNRYYSPGYYKPGECFDEKIQKMQDILFDLFMQQIITFTDIEPFFQMGYELPCLLLSSQGVDLLCSRKILIGQLLTARNIDNIKFLGIHNVDHLIQKGYLPSHAQLLDAANISSLKMLLQPTIVELLDRRILTIQQLLTLSPEHSRTISNKVMIELLKIGQVDVRYILSLPPPQLREFHSLLRENLLELYKTGKLNILNLLRLPSVSGRDLKVPLLEPQGLHALNEGLITFEHLHLAKSEGHLRALLSEEGLQGLREKRFTVYEALSFGYSLDKFYAWIGSKIGKPGLSAPVKFKPHQHHGSWLHHNDYDDDDYDYGGSYGGHYDYGGTDDNNWD